MMVSPPDFTPTEFRPTISQTVNSVSTAKNGIFGLDFSYFGSNERVLRLLVEFKSLRNNWDNEGALAPDQAAIYQAERLVKLLQIPGEKVFHAAPGPNGEVMIDIRNNGKSVEILFYPSFARFIKFPINGKPEQTEFNDDCLPQILKWLHE